MELREEGKPQWLYVALTVKLNFFFIQAFPAVFDLKFSKKELLTRSTVDDKTVIIFLGAYYWVFLVNPRPLHAALIECSVLDALPASSRAQSALQIAHHLLLSHPPRERRHLQIRWPQTCFINKTCSRIALRLVYCGSEMNST